MPGTLTEIEFCMFSYYFQEHPGLFLHPKLSKRWQMRKLTALL